MAKKRKNSLTRKLLWVAAGFVVFIFCSLLYLAFLLFGNVPDLPVEPLTAEDLKLQNRLISRFSSELIQGKPEISELVLTPDEVASLIRISDNGISLGGMLSGKSEGNTRKSHNARFENGRFEILSPVRTQFSWLWGGVIMIDMSIRPEKDGDALSMDISRMKAGSIPLPAFLVRSAAAGIVEDNRNHKDFQKFNRCVKSIRIDEENNLHIVYYPPEVRSALLF